MKERKLKGLVIINPLRMREGYGYLFLCAQGVCGCVCMCVCVCQFEQPLWYIAIHKKMQVSQMLPCYRVYTKLTIKT